MSYVMAPQRQAVFIHAPDLDRLAYPPASPFKTRRAGRTRAIISSMGLLSGPNVSEFQPQPASRETIELFHEPRYLDELVSAGLTGRLTPEGLDMGLGTPDCPVFPDMYAYPAMAAGATLAAAELVNEGRAHYAFNPSGGFHHAGPARAAGFCYLNDVVLACMRLSSSGRRVLFIDLDVHHSDGVQNAFYRRSDVMTISLHESGRTLFPGTGFEDEIGEGEGKGFSVNVPLPVGTYDEAYLRVVREVVLPLAQSYGPDVMVLELGMDALAGDPLAHLHLTNNAYADAVEAISGLGVPIVATGGGGYNPEPTARGWALMWSIFCGEGSRDDLSFGLGGVMLESTDWQGGLRDRVLISDGGIREAVDEEIARVIRSVKTRVFPLHDLHA